MVRCALDVISDLYALVPQVKSYVHHMIKSESLLFMRSYLGSSDPKTVASAAIFLSNIISELYVVSGVNEENREDSEGRDGRACSGSKGGDDKINMSDIDHDNNNNRNINADNRGTRDSDGNYDNNGNNGSSKSNESGEGGEKEDTLRVEDLRGVYLCALDMLDVYVSMRGGPDQAEEASNTDHTDHTEKKSMVTTDHSPSLFFPLPSSPPPFYSLSLLPIL